MVNSDLSAGSSMDATIGASGHHRLETWLAEDTSAPDDAMAGQHLLAAGGTDVVGGRRFGRSQSLGFIHGVDRLAGE